MLENVQLDEAHRMDELIEATKVWLEEEGSDMLRDAARDILQLYWFKEREREREKARYNKLQQHTSFKMHVIDPS